MFVSGSNRFGQLGLDMIPSSSANGELNRYFPHQERQSRIRMVCCGGFHSAFLIDGISQLILEYCLTGDANYLEKYLSSIITTYENLTINDNAESNNNNNNNNTFENELRALMDGSYSNSVTMEERREMVLNRVIDSISTFSPLHAAVFMNHLAGIYLYYRSIIVSIGSITTTTTTMSVFRSHSSFDSFFYISSLQVLDSLWNRSQCKR